MADLEVTLGADARQYNATMREAATQAARTSRALEQVPRGANQAGQALTNLGRIAQDAPYGFIGISNNLNPLLESFQRLRTETGSTGGALRALGASLVGGGGLGLALSAVSAAISFASIGLQAWGRKNTEAKKAIDEHAEAIKGFVNDSAKELAALDVLYDATQNTNLSLKDRKSAVDELQRQYPGYFANLKDETILAGKATMAYDKLSNSIINQAVIKAGQDSLEKTIKPYLELITAQRKAQAELDKSNSDRQRKNPAGAQEFKVLGEDLKEIKGYTEIVPTGVINRAIHNDFIELEDGTLQSITQYKNSTLTAIKDARAGIQQALADFGVGSLFDPAYTKPKKPKKVPIRLELLPEVGIGNTDTDALSQSAKDRVEGLINRSQSVTGSGLFGENDGNQRILQFQKEANANIELARASEQSTEAYNKQELQTKQLISTLGSGLQNTFESIITGSQSAISAIGQFLGQLVAKLIAAAAAAALLAIILSAVGFGGGIGGAASSAGSFKNLFNGLSGFTAFAEGGIVTAPTRALIGEGGEPEAVMPLSKLNKFVSNNGGGQMTGEFRVKGSDLLLVMERENKRKSRIS